jgi:hypothetical protein
MGFLYGDVEVTNLAVCWNSSTLVSTLYSENLTSYAQSAGNGWDLMNVSSMLPLKGHGQLALIHTSASETTRGKSFNYSAFTKVGGNTDIPHNWLTWFIGFAEGDGAILINSNTKQLQFVLTQKEGAILEQVRDTFGFGVVKYFEPGTAGNKNGFYRWIVQDLNNIWLLAHLFNGNLVSSHRINQLGLWIDVLNKSARFVSVPLTLIKDTVAITLQDAWLSGFTDAEGCFNVSVIKNSRYTLGYVVRLRFILDQKNEVLLNVVQALFGFGKVTERASSAENFRYTVHGFLNMEILRSYFALFPLLTKKSASLAQWNKIHTMVTAKQHLTQPGLDEVRRLSKLINLNNSQTNSTGASLARKTKI